MEVCIVSWDGQHEAAVGIYDALKPVVERCRIVFSDPSSDHTLDHHPAAERRDNALFWGDKFLACIGENVARDLLIIHADCKCSDWAALYENWRSSLANVPDAAVWCPFVLGSPWQFPRSDMGPVDGTKLRQVAQTDALVFGLRSDIVARMQSADYSQCKFGWGIDWMFLAYAYSIGARAVLDPSVRVLHRVGKGYSAGKAADEMAAFLEQLTSDERRAYQMITNKLKTATPA